MLKFLWEGLGSSKLYTSDPAFKAAWNQNVIKLIKSM
jgi:hypothetical protein